ncbi:MAG: hypothetical protein A2580_08935 [Hydrogenophilales bacterium RIFOXYD1_FULL_62_11]|nr:MAG: hypothetical protein A2580_08935 [Hydrogenophilales bacterium RIFOXYD1_FULL_62_11]
MAIKTTGAEFKQWLESDWGQDAWWEDNVVKVDGAYVDDDYDHSTIPDASAVVLEQGLILTEKGAKNVDAVRHFRAWRAAQEHTYVVVKVPKDQLDAFLATLPSFGAKQSKGGPG